MPQYKATITLPNHANGAIRHYDNLKPHEKKLVEGGFLVEIASAKPGSKSSSKAKAKDKVKPDPETEPEPEVDAPADEATDK